MLKHLTILTVLVLGCVSPAQHPIPTDGGKQQEHTQSNSSATNPSAPVLLPEDAKKKGPAEDKNGKQESKTKKYLEDAFAPANLSNWVLAALGIAGGIMAGITLRFIFKQTKILEDSVAAANSQIEMMKDKERARIQVTPLDFEMLHPDEPLEIMMEFVNIGPTIAFDIKVEAGGIVKITGLESEPGEYIDLAIPTLLKPDRPESSWAVCCFPPQWQDEVTICKAKIILEVNGEVRYRDIFGTVHTEPFAYRMNAYGIEQLPRDFIELKLMRKWHPFSLHVNERES